MPAHLPRFTLAFYADCDDNEPELHQLPWESDSEFSVVDLFSERDLTPCAPCPGGQKCKFKMGQAFAPGAPRPGATRSGDNVDWVSLLVFDVDHITRAELEGVCDRITGLESLISSTHSHLHGGPDDNCVRIVLPLSRPLSPSEFKHVHHEVRQRYTLEWLRPGAKKPSGADSAAKDISRLYFLPTAPIGSETIEGREHGELLDLDVLLRNFVPGPPRALQRAVLGPPVLPRPPSTGSVDLEALRRLLRGYHPHKRDHDGDEVIHRKTLVQRVEAGLPLVDVSEPGQRERSCHRVAKILAYLFPEDTPVEAVIELVRPSIMSMPVTDADGEKDTPEARFAKVEKSWFKGLEQRAQQQANRAQQQVEDDRLRQGFRKRFKLRSGATRSSDVEADDVVDESDGEPEGEPEPEESSDAEDDSIYDGWEQMLIWGPEKKDGSRSLANDDCNAKTILAYSPEWRNILRYNEVTKDVVIFGETPLDDHENTPTQVTTGVKYWLQGQGRLKLRLKKNDVMDAIVNVAKLNSFDPVKDYLNSLKWDGVQRIDTFLERYCGARLYDGDKDISKIVRRMSRCWLVGAVARGLGPGCKMDTVLILEGDQGVKKSTMLSVLGGEWFTDSPITIGDKDSKMLAGRSWIAELAELSAMHASAVESQKAFFSLRVDQFRPPYGYAIEEFPRRCVFAGSTNDDKYMNDITGNRRFWPVWCVKFDILGARRDRDQVWAEAVRVFKEGGENCPRCVAAADGEDRCHEHRWWFTEAENKELEAINNQRLKNEFAEAITSHILRLEPTHPGDEVRLNQRPRSYTMYEVATTVLSLTADRVSSQQMAIGRALKVLGFKKERQQVGLVREVRYYVPDNLLAEPQRRRTSPLERRELPPEDELPVARA